MRRISKIKLNWKLTGQLLSNCNFILRHALLVLAMRRPSLGPWLRYYGGMHCIANSGREMQWFCVPENLSLGKSKNCDAHPHVKAPAGASQRHCWTWAGCELGGVQRLHPLSVGVSVSGLRAKLARLCSRMRAGRCVACTCRVSCDKPPAPAPSPCGGSRHCGTPSWAMKRRALDPPPGPRRCVPASARDKRQDRKTDP